MDDHARQGGEQTASGTSGDCFVVMRTDGFLWDGSEWVYRWEDALQFRDQPDPYTPCEALADQLREAGFRAFPAYIPSRSRTNRR